MKIIYRYILVKLMSLTFLCLLFAITFYIFVDLLGRQLVQITEEGVPFMAVFYYYLGLLPTIFVQMLPLAVLIAILFTLGAMARSNEYTALLAGGYSIWEVVAPVVSFSLILVGIVFYVSEMVLPKAQSMANLIERVQFEREEPLSTFKIRHNLVRSAHGNRMYFFETYLPQEKALKGVTILIRRQDGFLAERIDAKRGQWEERQKVWNLIEGRHRHFDREGRIIKEEAFKRKTTRILQSPEELLVPEEIVPEEMSLNQLKQQIEKLKESGFDPTSLTVDYHLKFSVPFISLVVTLIGIPFVLRAKLSGLAFGFGVSIGIAVVYMGIMQIFTALGRGGSIPAFLAAWGANLFFFLIGMGLLYKSPS